MLSRLENGWPDKIATGGDLDAVSSFCVIIFELVWIFSIYTSDKEEQADTKISEI